MPTPGPWRSRPGVDPAGLPAALEAILVELARLRDELVPDAELTKAKRYLSGGLELRMDDTRHVASWIGGQEALHDRVLTLDEALAAVEAVDAAGRSSAWPAGSSATTRCAWPPSRRPATCAGSKPGCGCRHDRPMALPERAEPPAAGRSSWSSPTPTSASGRWPSPGSSSRRWPGWAASTRSGWSTSAEVRWRTGDLPGAGEAAAAALASGSDDPIALVIAAEAASSLGRPSEARRLATRAMACAPGTIDAIFAGMPRSGVWPPDADEPPPTAPTLFDRGPEVPSVSHAGESSAAPAATAAHAGRHGPAPTPVDPRVLGRRGRRGRAEVTRDLPIRRTSSRPGRPALVAGAVDEAGLPVRAGAAARSGPRAGRARGDRGRPRGRT